MPLKSQIKKTKTVLRVRDRGILSFYFDSAINFGLGSLLWRRNLNYIWFLGINKDDYVSETDSIIECSEEDLEGEEDESENENQENVLEVPTHLNMFNCFNIWKFYDFVT